MTRINCLPLFALLAGVISCKSKEKGDHIVNTGLGDINLSNKRAEDDFNKGIYWVRQENYSAAADFFLRADQESLNTPVILNAIGNCLDRTGDRRKGFTYYERALQIDSSFIRTYVNYGCSLNNGRRFNEAEKIFRLGLNRGSLSSFDRSSLYCNLADSYYHLNQNETALSLLDSAKAGLNNSRFYDAILQFENKIRLETQH
jgi:tetratricopeptide (TPR) repeat protein